MILYRIARSIHAEDLLGTGSALFGGRWNPIGTNMLYTSGSLSLAYLEYLAHNMHILNSKPVALVKIEVPEISPILNLKSEDLPVDWNNKSYTPQSTQEIGADFISKKSYHILKVPSVIVKEESNYLLNPLHPDHKHVKIIEKTDPFEMDSRLGG